MSNFEERLDEAFSGQLNESGLSRVWTHNKEHDCGAMTAFRKGSDCGKGEPYTKKQNKQRNKSLLAKIKSAGYSVTKLQGVYPEGGKTTKEESFFIVDINNTGKLQDDLKSWGEQFDQDSVLFVPKGAINGDAKAFLIGTNKCADNFLGFGKTMEFDKGKLGKNSPIYTSFVNGRPFLFEDVGDEVLEPNNGMGVWAMKVLAEKNWSDIDVD